MQPGEALTPNRAHGFSRCDFLFVIAAGSLLLLSAPGMSTRPAAERTQCANNLRQLGIAAFSFSDENGGELPPRRAAPNHWVAKLKPYYVSDTTVACPTGREREGTPHSYLINGFGDYFEGEGPWWLPPARGMRVADLPEPSATILFGEKDVRSWHVHMDLTAGVGNDLAEVDHGRHFASAGKQHGASNHTFADGTVRLLKFGGASAPTNLWAVLPQWRAIPLQPIK
jgi:hypothetical protein